MKFAELGKLLVEVIMGSQPPAPPEVLRCSKTWQFETKSPPPLTVEMKLFPRISETFPQSGVVEHKLYISIKGLENPCLGQTQYIGAESFNPAVRGARDIIIQTIEGQVAKSLKERSLITAQRLDVPGGKPATIFQYNSSDDQFLAIEFNTAESFFRPPNYKPATIKQFKAILSDIEDAIERARPDIEDALARDAEKRPDPADPQQARQAREQYMKGRAGAVSQLRQTLLGEEGADQSRLQR